MRKTILGVAVALAAALGAVNANAGYLQSYTLTNNLDQPITNIMIFQDSGDGNGSLTWAFGADASSTSTITNPFPIDTPLTGAMLVGLVQDLPGDAPGQQHIVLGISNEAASAANEIAWGTLFRDTLEENLISALLLATSGQDFDIIGPGVDAVFNFSFNDAQTGILGPGGVTIPGEFALGDDFTLMAWSDGQIIGSGTSDQNFVPPTDQGNDVPEPASIALLGAGLLGMARRRRT